MPHPSRTARFAWLAILAAGVLAAAAWLTWSPLTRAAAAPADVAVRVTASPAAPAAAAPPVVVATVPPAKPAAPGIVLTARERAKCGTAATACADLDAHVTWLQSGGRVTYGPLRMEPGAASDPTPRGTFQVAWKAGAHYISTSFDVPIPYAVFFAAGGIAFHAGSLSSSSHGCIHLTLAAARYYNEHLPVGAGVVVF
jgi:lipoprotein-anchoring transpeptidase ErfK/SrfK